jgi:hypothetical protein
VVVDTVVTVVAADTVVTMTVMVESAVVQVVDTVAIMIAMLLEAIEVIVHEVLVDSEIVDLEVKFLVFPSGEETLYLKVVINFSLNNVKNGSIGLLSVNPSLCLAPHIGSGK